MPPRASRATSARVGPCLASKKLAPIAIIGTLIAIIGPHLSEAVGAFCPLRLVAHGRWGHHRLLDHPAYKRTAWHETCTASHRHAPRNMHHRPRWFATAVGTTGCDAIMCRRRLGSWLGASHALPPRRAVCGRKKGNGRCSRACPCRWELAHTHLSDALPARLDQECNWAPRRARLSITRSCGIFASCNWMRCSSCPQLNCTCHGPCTLCILLSHTHRTSGRLAPTVRR